MSIPYRHKRALKRIGTLLAVLSLVFMVTWLCWVVWLQRYVIYTDDGAELNFALSSYELSGKEAVEPKAQQNPARIVTSSRIVPIRPARCRRRLVR